MGILLTDRPPAHPQLLQHHVCPAVPGHHSSCLPLSHHLQFPDQGQPWSWWAWEGTWARGLCGAEERQRAESGVGILPGRGMHRVMGASAEFAGVSLWPAHCRLPPCVLQFDFTSCHGVLFVLLMTLFFSGLLLAILLPFQYVSLSRPVREGEKARCSGCTLPYPCRATQGQSLTACHPVQPSWHLPPGVLAAYASKQGGFSWQAWAPAQLSEPHPASLSRSSPAGGGRGRGRRTVAEKDTMGLQGPAGSEALLRNQLSSKRQTLARQQEGN